MTIDLHLTPRPWKIEFLDGTFKFQDSTFALNASTFIQSPRDTAHDSLHAAKTLQEALRDLCGLNPPIIPTGKTGPKSLIRFTVLDDRQRRGWSNEIDPIDLGPEGYILRIHPTSVDIMANDSAGLFYGVQTLIQIARSQGRVWPTLIIHDRPAVPNRGFLVDITRGKVHTPETLEKLIRTFAHHKCNHLQLYIEHTFDSYPQWPEISHELGGLTAEDIIRLDEVCRENYIELAPNFQSLGHQGHLLKLPAFQHLAETPWQFTFATDNEWVFQFLGFAYHQFLACFTSRLFNVNADEPWDLGRGVSKGLTEKLGIGGVYLHHLGRLHELVTKHGFRMAMWADVLKHHPDLMPELPDDILLIDWWYEATEKYESLHALAASGREFWICAGTSSWMALYPRLENAIRNIREYTQQGVAAGANGVLVSDWGDNGHDQPLSNSLYPFIWGAECAWTGGTTESADFDAAFGLQVLRDRSGTQVAAIRRLGASTQTDKNWMTTWNTAMALYEDPLVGKVSQVTPPEVVEEARASAEAIQSLLSQIHDQILRADLGFVTWQIMFACDKAETTRTIRNLLPRLNDPMTTRDENIELLSDVRFKLKRQHFGLEAMKQEFEQRWLASARPSSIQFNLDRYDALIERFDRAFDWVQSQATAYQNGETVDATLSTYDNGGYAVLHEATYLWVKELEGIIGHDALPPDIQQYLRDVGGDSTLVDHS